MKKISIKFTTLALKDLEEILRYFSFELYNERRKNNFLKHLYEKLELISENPKMYRTIEDFYYKKYGYRKFIVDEFLIFYNYFRDKIYIIRMLHKKQNWINII